MKSFTLIMISLLMLNTSFANEEKYIASMKQNIQALYDAQSIEQLLQTVNALDRIGSVEKDKWEPQYYKAFGLVLMANREMDAVKKDLYLDQALDAITKAKEIGPNESEVEAVIGFVHMMRLTVDPSTRGPKYSALAMQSFSRAVVLNPENPRALALMAQMQFGTAQFFGSSTDEACSTVQKALEKFDTFTSENPLAPVWGKGMTEELKTACEVKGNK